MKHNFTKKGIAIMAASVLFLANASVASAGSQARVTWTLEKNVLHRGSAVEKSTDASFAQVKALKGPSANDPVNVMITTKSGTVVSKTREYKSLSKDTIIYDHVSYLKSSYAKAGKKYCFAAKLTGSKSSSVTFMYSYIP